MNNLVNTTELNLNSFKDRLELHAANNSVILNMQNSCSQGENSAFTWIEHTSRQILLMDEKFNAILEWNMEAKNIACALDEERKEKGPRSLLHGIPVLLKDNIDTGDNMHTSAGSLALADRIANKDSFVAMKLRQAGAILCGKTNMTEFANFMTANMSNGYSSRGGQVRHAWKEGADPLGSSTGSAVAVARRYVPLAIGTETCGSIISPAASAGIVALKPTVGWVSRSGIIPIAPSQDVAGPMARTVRDCAIAFSIMAGYDTEDPVTKLCLGHPIPGLEQCDMYSQGLKGVRLGIYSLDGEDMPVQFSAFHEAVSTLESLGAEIIPFKPPSNASRNMRTLFIHEFSPAIDKALCLGRSKARSLADIAAFNSAHVEECLKYGQSYIEEALAIKRPMETSEYMQSLQTKNEVLQELEQIFSKLSLDAVISLQGLIAFPVTGSPALTLPIGIDEVEGLPVPIVLNGLPFSEGKLLAIGAALESALSQ